MSSTNNSSNLPRLLLRVHSPLQSDVMYACGDGFHISGVQQQQEQQQRGHLRIRVLRVQDVPQTERKMPVISRQQAWRRLMPGGQADSFLFSMIMCIFLRIMLNKYTKLSLQGLLQALVIVFPVCSGSTDVYRYNTVTHSTHVCVAMCVQGPRLARSRFALGPIACCHLTAQPTYESTHNLRRERENLFGELRLFPG